MNHDEIANRAASYVSRRDEPEWSEADQSELQAWLDESYAHKAAYWRLARSWEMTGRLAASRPQRFAPWQPQRSLTARVRRHQRKVWLAVAGASAFMIVGVQLVHAPEQIHPALKVTQTSYSTPVGGQETIKLADGSVAELNTATRVRTAATPTSRQVWLDDGEAFFKVAHDAAHPFVVHAGRYRVTVLGTSFSVRRSGQNVSVSVLDGRVRVDDTQSSNAAQKLPVLTAGQMAILRPSEALVSLGEGERVERALAWRNGMLSFDGAALADVVADFNRYDDRKIVVENSRVAGIRITGSFRVKNSDAFLRLLRQAYGLRVDDEGDVVKISE